MNELDFVKSLIEGGIDVVLIAYIFHLDRIRVAAELASRLREKEMADARAEDNNRWLAVFARGPSAAPLPFTSKSPTSLEQA